MAHAAEKKFLDKLNRGTLRLLFSRKNGPKKNPERHVPRQIEIRPVEAKTMIRLNNFMANAINWMGKKVQPGMRERALIRVRMIHLRDTNRRIRAILGKPGRTAPLYITGQEAELYFHILELVHASFNLIKRNFAESARDMKSADAVAQEAWWAIRSLINVGHLPAQKSKFTGR